MHCSTCRHLSSYDYYEPPPAIGQWTMIVQLDYAHRVTNVGYVNNVASALDGSCGNRTICEYRSEAHPFGSCVVVSEITMVVSTM